MIQNVRGADRHTLELRTPRWPSAAGEAAPGAGDQLAGGPAISVAIWISVLRVWVWWWRWRA